LVDGSNAVEKVPGRGGAAGTIRDWADADGRSA
jgi:hypothetical protein